MKKAYRLHKSRKQEIDFFHHLDFYMINYIMYRLKNQLSSCTKAETAIFSQKMTLKKDSVTYIYNIYLHFCIFDLHFCNVK